MFFFIVSRLKFNLHKFNLYGVCTLFEEIKDFSLVAGCRPDKLPFIYLGLPVEQNMSRVVAWNLVIDRFQKRLSNWKAATLSIGGRSMLIKSVLGSLGIYFMSLFLMSVAVLRSWNHYVQFFWGGAYKNHKIWWVQWEMVLAGKNNGVLRLDVWWILILCFFKNGIGDF